MNLSKAVWKVLLEESIEAIRDEIDKDMPLSGISVLLSIPDKGKTSIREIEKRVGLPHSTCSRAISLLAGLSKTRINGGLNLVQLSDDPVDRRYRYAELTEAGRQQLDKAFQRVASRVARIQSVTNEGEA